MIYLNRRRPASRSRGRDTSSLLIVFLFIACAGLQSCVYENTDIYVSPIQPPTGEGSSIDLNSVSEDIVIHKPTAFRFKTYPTDKGEYAARVVVTNSPTLQLTSQSGDFYFVVDPALTGSGEKTIMIEVTYPSRSPSLAGQLGLELLTLSKQWTIQVDITVPSAIPAPHVYLEDGRSMVSWNTPNLFTFTELILFRCYFSNSGVLVHRDSIKIQDHHTTLFHDASYVGGPVSYRVDLKGYKFYVVGSETFFNVTPLQFSIDSLAAIPVVSWKKSPLYNNDIKIHEPIVHAINEAGTLEADVRFGQPNGVRFKIQANNPPPSQVYSAHEYEVYTVVTKGVKIPPFGFIRYLPDEKVYVASSNSSTLYKIDAETLAVISELDITGIPYLITSQNGQHVLVRSDTKLYRVDINSMTKAEIDLTTILGSPNHFFNSYSYPSISDNNIMTCSFIYAGTIQDYVIDLSTQQIVWQGGNSGFPQISQDGQYLYSQGSIYKNNSNNWSSLLGTIPDADQIRKVEFRQDTRNQLIVYSQAFPDEVTYLFDLNSPPDGNGNLIALSSFAHSYFTEFDPYTQQFSWINRYSSYLGASHIFDAQDFQEVEYLDNIYDYENVFFINGHFFHRLGYYLP